jgi:DNA-binding transcriptional LysR family regulator
MNLRNIESFLAVGEAGSFTGAAKRLDKTQSAVSQAVRQLEIELGVTLIDRESRQVTFTPAGELLRSHAAQLVEDMHKMASMVREQSKTRLSQLRIGLVDSFATAVGPALIRSMLSEALNLTLWSEFTPRLGKALLEKRADIIVANDPFTEAANLTRHELLREPFVLLLPAGVPWDSQAPNLPLLARAYPMIRYESSSLMGSLIDAQCHRLNLRPTRRVSVDSTEKLIATVVAGIGWSISTPISLLRSREHSWFPFRVKLSTANCSWCPGAVNWTNSRCGLRACRARCWRDWWRRISAACCPRSVRGYGSRAMSLCSPPEAQTRAPSAWLMGPHTIF